MNFAIMGTGGVGGYIGGRLAAAGYDVSFVARGQHLDAIKNEGLKLESTGGDLHINPAKATDNPMDIGPVDTVIFTPKLWDTESAGEAIRPLIGPDTAVISFQNGIDPEEKLIAILGQDHVMGGVCEIEATIAKPGLVRHLSPFARFIFGELDGTRSSRAEGFIHCGQEAEINIEIADDINVAIWEKFVALVAFSGITAATRHSLGAIREDPVTRGVMEDLMEETASVARAKGVAISENVVDEWMGRFDGLPPAFTSSMARDIEQGNRLETQWFQGEVVRLGRKLGVETPANGFVYAALKLSANGVTR